MYPVIFTRAARAELIDAQDWYENEVSGLGRHFRAAVDAVIERMSDGPEQFPVIHKKMCTAPCYAAFPMRSCSSSKPIEL